MHNNVAAPHVLSNVKIGFCDHSTGEVPINTMISLSNRNVLAQLSARRTHSQCKAHLNLVGRHDLRLLLKGKFFGCTVYHVEDLLHALSLQTKLVLHFRALTLVHQHRARGFAIAGGKPGSGNNCVEFVYVHGEIRIGMTKTQV